MAPDLQPIATADGIENELELLMAILDGTAAAVAGEAVADVALLREAVADAAPRERFKVAGPTFARVAAAGIATLPAVLTPLPAFAGTPLPPNLMLAMAARPAAPPAHDVPPALAATGPQLFPFTRSMQSVRAQASLAPTGDTVVAAKAGQFSLNPRLRSIFSEQRQVSITTKRELTTTFYNVQRGDSLYSIAADVLGSGPRWREIYDSNKDKIGAGFLLQPGQRLSVATRKPAAVAIAKAPRSLTTTTVAAHVTSQTTVAASVASAANTKSYVVTAGDNLYSIAEKQLGKATRWKEIVMLNKALLNGRTLIYPNQWLVLPNSQV